MEQTSHSSRFVIAAAALVLVACGGSETTASDTAQADGASAPAAIQVAAAETEEAPAVAPDPVAVGKRQFAICSACHATSADAPPRIGPHLAGIAGRDIASLDFAYSSGLSGVEGTWTDEKMDAFLEAPQTFAPGNRMAYAGERDPAKRAALIAYMKTLK